MQVAVFPSDCSKPLRRRSRWRAEVLLVDDLVTTELGEMAVLVVELGEEPMRRLRQLEPVADDVGLPVLVVADRASLPLIERAKASPTSSSASRPGGAGRPPASSGGLRRIGRDPPVQDLG